MNIPISVIGPAKARLPSSSRSSTSNGKLKVAGARPQRGVRLEATTDGTIVTQYCTLGPGRSGLNAAIENRPDKEHKIIAYRLAEHAENMERNLEGIAGLI